LSFSWSRSLRPVFSSPKRCRIDSGIDWAVRVIRKTHYDITALGMAFKKEQPGRSFPSPPRPRKLLRPGCNHKPTLIKHSPCQLSEVIIYFINQQSLFKDRQQSLPAVKK
jgi:hypothetical protein